MEFLSDDPTYLAVGLGVLGLIFLVMLKVTQQGKYLIYAGVAVAVLALLLVVERLWVTDAERIEDVVYGVARAVEVSDADAAAEFLTPDCVLDPSPDRGDIRIRYVSNKFAGPLTRSRLEAQLPELKFDYLKITRIQAHAGKLTGLGTAEFTVHAMGTPGIITPPAGMGWSVGLREVAPHVWKITRVTPGRRERE